MMKMNAFQFKDIMKGFYDGPHATPDPSEEGPVFLGIKNIYDDGGIDFSDIRHISEKEYPKWTKRVAPQKDDLVFSYEATLHKYALIPENFRGCLGRRMALIRVNKSFVSEKYLYYYFLSPYWKSFVETIKISGSTVDRISISEFPNYKISLPSIHLQHEIASILTSYDELIENNKQRIKLLEEMAGEIYKEWFVRLRFPGWESTKRFGEDGGLPEGWKRVKLRDCLAYYIGGGWGEETPRGKTCEPAYVIRGTDIPDARVGNLNIEVLRYHSLSNLSGRKLQENDIVFEVSGGTESQSLGRTLFISKSLLNKVDRDVICASFCKLIRTKTDSALGLFVYYLLNRLYTTGEIMLYQVQSTGISNYKFEDFIENQKILLPSIQIQHDFVGITQPMYDEIQLLGAKNLLLQQTRDLLLPRLISGKLSAEHLVEQNPDGVTG